MIVMVEARTRYDWYSGANKEKPFGCRREVLREGWGTPPTIMESNARPGVTLAVLPGRDNPFPDTQKVIVETAGT